MDNNIITISDATEIALATRALTEATDLISTKLNRVEVIDPTGRAYVYYADKITIEQQLQDGGKTLKIFIS